MIEDAYTLTPGSSIRFKTCGELGYDCLHCPRHDCRLRGNYDIDGYRYEKFARYEEFLYLRTETSIRVALTKVDVYTYNPDNIMELPL